MALTHIIIGAGNMGGALLSGWLADGLVKARNVGIVDPRPGSVAAEAIADGASHLGGVADIPQTARVVLLAIKPQMFAGMKADLSALPDGTLLISILAGTALSDLQAAVPDCDVVRAMPNTPASIGLGMTAYVADDALPADVVETVEAMLGACGEVVRVGNDDQINAVTAISGSGPAYIFHLCEALTGAGVAVGLSEDTAARLARQTLIGASGLLQRSDDTPEQLRVAVTSPGGTTQAALDVLMGEDGMAQLMRRAAKAALDRARELAKG